MLLQFHARSPTVITVIAIISSVFISACTTQPKPVNAAPDFTVQLLGINDFHGQVLPKDGMGGMYYLASHLIQAINSTDEHTFVLHAGDHVGASPAESALLQDEPAIEFLNILSSYCHVYRQDTCQIIGTAGNHEFDEGSDELLRLFNGGNHENGPFIETWQGANYLTLSANVIDQETQDLLLKPYTIQVVNDVTIGFIGITLDSTPELVVPGIVNNLTFQNQSLAVAKTVSELQSQAVEAIVVIIHDGTEAEYYQGSTLEQVGIPKESLFGQFLSELPGAVDLVVTGHSHEFTNAYVENSQGKKMLVTQAYSSGEAYADISITINPESKDVVASSAEIILVDKAHNGALNKGANNTLRRIQRLIAQAADFAQQYTQKVLNFYEPSEGEAPLGQFIADSHRYMLNTDIAVMNDGGVRAELEPGEITWGELFAVQPFNNSMMIRRYSGAQLATLIDSEHYWSSEVSTDASQYVTINDAPIDMDAQYTVAGNAYIMSTDAFKVGELIFTDNIDVVMTSEYIKRLPTPFNFNDTPSP